MSKRMTVYLQNQTRGEILTLPINPDQIAMPNEMITNIYNVIDFGEISIVGDRRSKTISLKSLFLNDDALENTTTTYTNLLTGAINNIITRQSAINKIKTWQEKKDLIRVVISDYFNELMKIQRFEPVVLESCEVIFYTLDLVEYRDPTTSTALNSVLSILASGLTSRSSIKALADTVLAKASDDLYSIATKYTGDSANWTSIAEKNGLSIDSDIAGKILKL